MHRTLAYIIFITVSLGVAYSIFSLAYRANLNQLTQTGKVRVEQAADRLLGQLEPFQQLPNLLARHPVVVNAVKKEIDPETTNNFLANTALSFGADAIFVVDLNGIVIAASDFEQPYTELGKTWENSAYLQRAFRGGLGFHRGIDARTGARDFFIARGIFDDNAPLIGAVIVRVDVAQLEFEWDSDDAVLAFFDSSNIVFATNRVELRLNYAGTDLQRRQSDTFYFNAEITSFPATRAGNGAKEGIGKAIDTNVLPSSFLVLSERMPRINMMAQIFLDISAAAQNARVLGYLAFAVMLVIGAGILALGQRRRRLADRLRLEAAANARLEARVEERTEQLQLAQEQLVQAGKLTALGQMSAGISHEVNQPLAAIRNFAANGVKLIERGRQQETAANLEQITQQVDRITRIIKNLRGFARNEIEVAEPVNISVVLKDVVKLATKRMRDEKVDLIFQPVAQKLEVMGGPIRLQQVLINLMNNAIDAMVDADEKTLSLSVLELEDEVKILVCDTGSGLADPKRVFEPFYTTKEIGASKGLGLGLSISYGIIGSFGGELTCRNLDKGAEFCVSLRKVKS